MKNSFITGYLGSLSNPMMGASALKVALVVGSVLFLINHGAAVAQGKMSRGRWVSAFITYCVPYRVNIHGQYVAQKQCSKRLPIG